MIPILARGENRQWLRLRCGNGCGVRAATPVEQDAVRPAARAQRCGLAVGSAPCDGIGRGLICGLSDGPPKSANGEG